ncbi:MAG: cryptochrome/photolyase family protein, partial [Chitinophagales bacterium]
MASLQTVTIHWFRRDLRLEDNAALFHALQQHTNVLPVFIFDKNILDDLEDKTDARITYIHACLKKLNRQLETHGSSVLVFYDKPLDAWKKILSQFHVDAVYANHDYEPYARERDAAVKQLFAEKNIPLHTFKDQVIFEKGEVVKDDGTPYTVFTPYSKKWKAALDASPLKVYPTEKYFQNFKKTGTNTGKKIPSLQEIGFQPSAITIPPSAIDEKLIIGYDKTRDFPAVPGTSRLSVHLRFGTISIRHLVKKAIQLNEKYWNELIWREFYQMILWHFPHVVNSSFRKEYDNIRWRNHEKEFQLWCEGKTGYPIVDAGMRELNTTG